MTQKEMKELANAICENLQTARKEILTMDEAVLYTGLTKSYLYKLTSTRAIPHYKPTGKMCYFKRTELDAWLTANRVSTSEEIDDKVQEYCRKNRPRISTILKR